MNSTVQIEACTVTTEIQSGSMSMVATIPISTDKGFSFFAWLSKITMKRRKVVVPPNNLPIKKNKIKSLKDKIVSRIVVDSKKTKFAEITKPLVFTKIELGK